MERASRVLSACMLSSETWLWFKSWLDNEFFTWVKQLDWVDWWHDYIVRSSSSHFTPRQRNALDKDAFRWGVPFSKFKPWIWSWHVDLEKWSYYMELKPDWTIVRNAKWEPVYRYHDTWEIVDWEALSNKKEKFLWFFSRDEKKMIWAPIWYSAVKNSMNEYVTFLQDNHPNLMTNDWFSKLRHDVKMFFTNIERWKWQKNWWNVIYDLFTSERWNHWYLMSKIMTNFDRILSDRETADKMLWYNFTEVDYRKFSEAAAAYADMARWWNLTVVDMLWREYADIIYWKVSWNLYKVDESTWKVTKLDTPEDRVLTKKYFMSLSVSQQIEQIKYSLKWHAPDMNEFWNWVKIKVWYNSWWSILRFINFIWRPSVFSLLMSVWKWLTWFMPLVILNSWMFVTELLTKKPRIDWDWTTFLRRRNLWDWLPRDVWPNPLWIWESLWDNARRCAKRMMNATEQWWFNAWDLLMQNTYKVRQYQLFFQAHFPGITSLEELDRNLRKLQKMEREWLKPAWTMDRLLEAARWYAEYSVRQATTNSSVTAALTRINPARNPLNQPMKDTFYSLWHFFSWWWYNKIIWAWEILKTWFWNAYRWEIWAQYLDQLLKWWASASEISGLMARKYLENEDFIYFLTKLHMSMLIWKYLDRLSEDWKEKDWDTLFEDFSDMMSYMDIFSWDYAALTANPEWRMIKNFLDMFIWELENDAWFWTATKAWIEAAAKEAFRSFFRKMYLPQISVEAISLLNAEWDSQERNFYKIITKSISDNVNGYLFYLKDKTENWEYDYYIPKWPNAFVNSILGKSPKSIQFINEQKNLTKLWNIEWMFNPLKWNQYIEWNSFHNWVIYSFPFLKQWNISQIKDVEWFIDDHDKFRRTNQYKQLIEWELPSDFSNSDYEYAYNIIVWRLAWSKEAIHNDTLWTEYKFVSEEWETLYNKARQSQENLIHLLMKNKLSKEQIDKFTAMMEWKTDKFDEEAIRTLAYMEANTPWSSYQALAYMLNNEWFNYVFRSWIKYTDTPESQELKKQRTIEWKIKAAQKYAKYIPYVDRNYSWTQIILHYAKVHDTPIAKYISWPWENNAWAMKLITPGSEETDWYIHQNKILKQNFQAQLMVDIEWANGNPNARKLMNWFAFIFDTSSYEKSDWTLDPKYSAYALNQIETVLNHIDSLAIDRNDKRILKEWAFMFWDKLFPNIINDEKLMQRSDVRNIVRDWTHYRYWEFKELNDIAIEAAEDQLQNDEWKRKWAKKNYFNWWASKKFPWFVNRYDYMKNRAYSNNYMKYRVFDWTPRTYEKDYLSKFDFNQARRYAWWTTKLQEKTSKWKWSKNDNWIWVTSKRWKSIQFYKREDIDKPVEYKTPWRKRWVKKWSGVKPISSRTWKNLTPNPK